MGWQLSGARSLLPSHEISYAGLDQKPQSPTSSECPLNIR